MKKQISIFIFLTLVSVFAEAQSTFQKTYGTTGHDWAYCTRQTTDSGYIITGLFDSKWGLLKTDVSGNALWTKTFGVNGDGYFVTQTTDSGYIILGQYDLGGGTNQVPMLIKTNTIGDTLWVKMIGTFNTTVQSLEQTMDGGFVCAGSINLANGKELYLVKTDTAGNFIWAKSYRDINAESTAAIIKQTVDSGYIIAGYSTIFSSGNSNISLVKTDDVGNLIWNKDYDIMGNDVIKSVKQTNDGGYILSGYTNNGQDAFLLKTDSSGTFLWTKIYGGPGYDEAFDASLTTDGGFILAGHTNSFGIGGYDVYAIKTDSSGNLQWSKTYGGTNFEWALSVKQALDNGYVIGAYTNSFGSGNTDMYLIKTDSLGNSSCNQTNAATTVSTHSTIDNNPSLMVTSQTAFHPPYTVTDSNNIVITTSCTTSHVNENASLHNQISIIPNPSNGMFKLLFETKIINRTVEIFSATGTKVYSDKIAGAFQKEMNLKNMDAGIYFVKVLDGSYSTMQKLIIE